MTAILPRRLVRLTVAIPVDTPGDYTHTTSDVVEITDLRVRFSVTKTRDKHPNTAEITVTNLSPSTRGKLQKKGIKVRLEAGYSDAGAQTIFVGDARYIDHIREGAEWSTVLRCGDGERGFRFARATESFAAGTTIGDVLGVIADKMGLDVGNAREQASALSARFDSGYAIAGSAWQSMDRLMGLLGWEWSIQDGALQVLPPGGSVGTVVPLITPDSGLVGSPEMGSAEQRGKPALLKFKCLLRPLRPGGRVRLRSERYDGEVAIQRVTLEGDTAGGPWYADAQGVLHAS